MILEWIGKKYVASLHEQKPLIHLQTKIQWYLANLQCLKAKLAFNQGHRGIFQLSFWARPLISISVQTFWFCCYLRVKFKKERGVLIFRVLECTTRYVGLLPVSAEGFSWSLFGPLAKKKTLTKCKPFPNWQWPHPRSHLEMLTFWQKFQQQKSVSYKLLLLLSELTKTHSCVKVHFEFSFHCVDFFKMWTLESTPPPFGKSFNFEFFLGPFPKPFFVFSSNHVMKKISTFIFYVKKICYFNFYFCWNN